MVGQTVRSIDEVKRDLKTIKTNEEDLKLGRDIAQIPQEPVQPLDDETPHASQRYFPRA